MSNHAIILGDARVHHPSIADSSVRCCVTSPPYWGLRDYGVEGQIGLEPTPEAWVAEMVNVFRHVRRYMADDGTLWVNMGDAYAGAGRAGYAGGMGTLQGSTEGQDRSRVARMTQSRRRDDAMIPRSDGRVEGMKPKDLIGLPWMLAFALRADGWYLRSDIIWHKPNPMPESVTDRPTKSHEYIFLFSKSPRYHFDADAIAEPISDSSVARLAQDVESQAGSLRANGGAKTNGAMKAVKRMPPIGGVKAVGPNGNGNVTYSGNTPEFKDTRNSRSVWTIPTQGYSGAHFATFPRELAARCVKAGSAAGDLVLDPFLGTGTTVAEALLLGRRGVGIELSPESVKLARERLDTLCPLFAHGHEAKAVPA